MNVRKLQDLGLTLGEARIYLALRKCGVLSKTDLSIQSGVSSSKIYEVSKRLANKGLISILKKNCKTQFIPGNPKNILSYVQSKKEDFDKQEKLAKQLISSSSVLERSDKKYPFVYEGPASAKFASDIFLEGIQKGDVIYGLGIKLGDRGTLHNYNKERVIKGVKEKFIFSTRDLNDIFHQGTEHRFLEGLNEVGIGVTKNRVTIRVITSVK
jgi:sugar-specific transcriptional regulator TrmB